MAYRHGVYGQEVPTSIIPPARISAGLPVIVGTAPVNLAKSPVPVNTPVLCYTYQEAVDAFGFSKDWASYTLCEAIYSQFALFNVSPVVLINVLDQATHKTSVASGSVALSAGIGKLEVTGVLLSTLTVRLDAGGTLLTQGTDYSAAFDDDGKVLITRITTGSIPANQATLSVAYDKLNPAAVVAADVIGGVDAVTGDYEGLELINQIFPRFRLIPGLIMAPGFSQLPAVAAVMTAKASNINGHFKAIALTDVPDSTTNYSDVAAWKNSSNYTSALQAVCWPKVKLGEDVFHLSTQLAGVICKTDSENEDIPYVSPSNKSLQANGAIVAGGKEVNLGPDQGAYLNSQGIITALNFIGGWKAWGNRTGIYPGVTDPKDAFLPIRRMFNWIENTLILTFWQKVDYPVNRRLVDTIVDSANIWLNGLAARQFILGGRVVFTKEENPTTDLMDGIIRFHVYVTPPGPAREIDFIVEYDPKYLQTLFGE